MIVSWTLLCVVCLRFVIDEADELLRHPEIESSGKDKGGGGGGRRGRG